VPLRVPGVRIPLSPLLVRHSFSEGDLRLAEARLRRDASPPWICESEILFSQKQTFGSTSLKAMADGACDNVRQRKSSN